MTRFAVYHFALWTCLLGVVGSVWAEDETDKAQKPLSERWIPGISVGLILFDPKVEGTITGTTSNTSRFSDVSSTNGDATVPRLQLGLELMSPALADTAFRPRAVVFGGAQIMGPNERTSAAGAGSPFPVLSVVQEQIANAGPSLQNGPNQGFFPDGVDFRQQGSVLSTEHEIAGWFFGLGMVFEYPGRDDEDPALRIRPFVSYVGEQVHLDGRLIASEGQPFQQQIPTCPQVCTPNPNPVIGTPYSIFQGSVSEKETFHYVGPGIDAELIVGSLEYATISLFATVSFLWNVGDSSITLNDATGVSSYNLKFERLTIRPGGGLRIRWRGGI